MGQNENDKASMKVNWTVYPDFVNLGCSIHFIDIFCFFGEETFMFHFLYPIKSTVQESTKQDFYYYMNLGALRVILADDSVFNGSVFKKTLIGKSYCIIKI